MLEGYSNIVLCSFNLRAKRLLVGGFGPENVVIFKASVVGPKLVGYTRES